jgi:hypothetical protein
MRQWRISCIVTSVFYHEEALSLRNIYFTGPDYDTVSDYDCWIAEIK